MDMYEDRSFRTNFAVGLLTIAIGLGLGAVVQFFIAKERPLSKSYAISVRFADVAGLKTGAPVTLMGAGIGRVERLELVGPAPPRYPESAWAAHLQIQDAPWVREKLTTRSTFTVQPESVFGNKFVNVTFGDGGEPIPPGAVIPGTVAAGIDARTFDKLSVALDNLSGAAGELRSILAAPPPSSGTNGDPEPGAASASAQPNLRETVASLDRTLKNAAEASQVLKEALSTENQGKVKQTFDDVSKSAANLANVTERMKTGMDSWAETMERMRFWHGWFGNNDEEKKKQEEEKKKKEKEEADKKREAR